MFKIILLVLAGYLVYTFFVKPKALHDGAQRNENIEDEFVDYEDVTDE
ncbi:MAG: hypothetical protein HKN87_01950 [Saprospiraceae bacterium]|nr:hypothetical protein [Saprospiraceae bacterium]